MTDKTSNSQKSINRREMLKKGALAAGGAITAAAFLDGKWLKPVVKTGVLPVHAQASACAEYIFTPLFVFIEEFTWNLSVTVIPVGPDGPISYEITDITNVTLSPGVGSSGSGTLSGGTATFSTDYSYSFPAPEPPTRSITIRWTYGGCDYTQTYDFLEIREVGD